MREKLQTTEKIMLSIRMREGISYDDLAPHHLERLANYKENGYVSLHDDRVTLTPVGRLIADRIVRELVMQYLQAMDILVIALAVVFVVSGLSKASGNAKGLSGTRDVNVPDWLARLTVNQVLRACRFESYRHHFLTSQLSWLEHLTFNEGVTGSSPVGVTYIRLW